MFEQMTNAKLDELHFRSDSSTGLHAIIAIHNTRLGPALGGTRFISYDSTNNAITDAIRLAKGMSYKAALAGIESGGGKAVIIKPLHAFDRNALFNKFGEFINSLNGNYITAMDSGTTMDDMDAIATKTQYVTSTTRSGDPSPYTAKGVFLSIKAAVAYKLGKESLDGVTIAVQGLGHVGGELVRLLAEADARIIICDVDKNKTEHFARCFKTDTATPDAIYQTKCDVFAPCGLGAILNDQTIPQLQCKIIAGAANNQLTEERHGLDIFQRDILYAPDYVVNAGGLIYVALNHQGISHNIIYERLNNIENSLSQIFEQADNAGTATSEVADQLAEDIIFNQQ